ncbi:hypothetical protein [Methylomonas methanica]|uniref:Glycosyl hydrolase family 13 catalytic domain-containing protein n=1 Tax=Methylomonas methanica TaxID=421 RepID=A0A177M6S1_METMH|nr:hypothetical protein [Methylomonas methanica]OAI01417.1 hypothetical protein A1332_17755 [Methylomonas methanica]
MKRAQDMPFEASVLSDGKAFDRQDDDCHETIIYQPHMGTFTAGGSLVVAMRLLDHLLELGVSAIGLMPVADFQENRNRGYDGVLLFASLDVGRLIH